MTWPPLVVNLDTVNCPSRSTPVDVDVGVDVTGTLIDPVAGDLAPADEATTAAIDATATSTVRKLSLSFT
jgi:hypothetical protein